MLTRPVLDFATADPALPQALLVGGALVLLGVLGLLFRRRMRRGLIWRGLAGLCVLGGLIQPLWRQQDRTPLDNIVLAVMDDSDSMALENRQALRDAALGRLRDELAQRPGWRLQTTVVTNSGQGTRLSPVLHQELATLPTPQLAGVVVIGDGIWPDAAAARRVLPATVPVTALLTGDPDRPDRWVTTDTAPPYGLVGRTLRVMVHATDTAAAAQAPLPVTLSGEGFSTTITIPNRGKAVAELPIRHAGPNTFMVAVAPRQDEMTLLNNRRLITVEGVRDRLRVLLVSGLPHLGGRSWRTLFRNDPLVDLVHFTILRPPEIFDPVPQRELALIPFPVDDLFSDRINRFDLVVFDRYARLGVLNTGHLNAIVRYVEQGGGLLVSMGPEALTPGSLFQTPLRRLLPIRPPLTAVNTSIRPVVTDRGRTHPVTADLVSSSPGQPVPDQPPAWGPWPRFLRATSATPTTGLATGPATTAVVLATPDGAPLLTLADMGPGKGRVAQLMGDGIGVWQRGYENGGPFDRLLRHVAHWLMHAPELEETRLVAGLEDDALVVRRYGEATTTPPTFTLDLPDATRRTLTAPETTPSSPIPTVRLPDPQPGIYRITSGPLSTFASIRTNDRTEFATLAPQPRQAAQLADSVISLHTRPDFRMKTQKSWQRGHSTRDVVLHDRAAFTLEDSREIPLLPPLGWGILATVFLVLGWFVEGRRRGSA